MLQGIENANISLWGRVIYSFCMARFGGLQGWLQWEAARSFPVPSGAKASSRRDLPQRPSATVHLWDPCLRTGITPQNLTTAARGEGATQEQRPCRHPGRWGWGKGCSKCLQPVGKDHSLSPCATLGAAGRENTSEVNTGKKGTKRRHF